MAGPVIYSLTELTGERRNENRRTVILTVEVKRRTFLVSAFAFAASFPVTGLLFVVAGVYALFFPILAIGVALWLWDSRQRNGLKLLNYQAIIDSRKAKNGVLYAAGAPIPKAQLVMHQRQTIPTPEETSGAPLAVGVSSVSRSTSRARKNLRAGSSDL